MAPFKTGMLVWYWDGTGRRTGVITTWGRKAVTILPTPCGKIKLTRVAHVEINEHIPWGGGRKRMSFKGWLRLVRKHGAAYGYTAEAKKAVRKLEELK